MSKIISPKKRFRKFAWTLNGEYKTSTIAQRITTAEFVRQVAHSCGVAPSQIKVRRATN